MREGRRTGKLQVRLVTTDGELDAGAFALALSEALGERLSGVLWTRSRSLAETTAGGETELVWGEAELPERLGELDLRISAEAFFQTNTEMAELLYGIVARVRGAARAGSASTTCTAGIGTIALTLAPRAGELWGIELVEQAVADAIAAARRNEVTNAHFFAGDTRLALRELVQRAGRPDVLVVDPPRAGLSKKVVRRIIEASPKRIVYVSCNPTTLAPNAAELVEAGWTLRRVRPVDMFPQTHHIECVALLERLGSPVEAESEISPTSPDRLPRCAPPPSASSEIVIEEHPDPVPGTGEVLVRVRAAGLNGARHDAATRPVPGAARLAAGHPRHGARGRGGGARSGRRRGSPRASA